MTIPCGDLPAGQTLWKADPNSSLQVILPDTTSCTAGVTVPASSQLVIDGSNGPIQVFSHGVGINVDGGSMSTVNTSAANSVTFDAEPDVPSWNGLTFSADTSGNRGNGWLEYVSVQHAITAITVNSGATITQRVVGAVTQSQPYGLYVNNSGIGPSYFDGINVQDTPVSVTGMNDGRLGTINNIGSRGIEANFSKDAPTPTVDSLHVQGIVFGSSAPFGAPPAPPSVVCDPTKPICGTIGNEAIFGSFARGHNQPVSITGNQILRTGAYGIQLLGVDNLTLQDNVLDCSGTGSATPIADQCQGTGLKYPALFLNDVTWSFDGGTSGNTGFQNGFDAIAFNGKAGANVAWQTPVVNTAQTSALGYFINGSLDASGHTLTVNDADVVKVKDGGITLSGGILDASSAGQKTFTSVRDNSVGLKLCPSVFAQSCPTTLPTHEWAGITVNGTNGTGTATIANATIAYAIKAINVTSGATSLAGGYALAVTDSQIGPTFSDGVSAQGSPILLSGDTFVAGIGDHGVNADFSNAPSNLGGGLTVKSSIHGPTTFQGSVNEAILGTGLGSQTVSITGTVIQNAGSYGIQLQGADNLTLTGNDISSSGTTSPKHSAIYLNGVSGDFGNGTTTGKIRRNTGTGNGLNGIVFHGKATTATVWQTVGKNSPALGYLLDGSLEVDGNLTLTNDVAETLSGGITVKGGLLNSTDSTFTSLRDNVSGIPTCGTVFVPQLPQPSTGCLAAAAGDWNGLTLDITGLNALTGTPAGTSEIRFAATGISIGDPLNAGTAQVLSMTNTNVRSVTGDGVNAQLAVISVSGGTFSNIAQHGIKADFSDNLSGQSLTVDSVTFNTVGREAIFADSLAKQTVTVTNNHIDGAGTSGIYLQDASDPTVSNNTVLNSGNPPALNPAASFPAIYLDGVKGDFTNKIFGNTGAHSGVNAIAFHGEATDTVMTWQTARPSSNVNSPPALGYVLDDSLVVDGQLTLAAGDIVKMGKGSIKLTAAKPNDATLSADDTGSSSQKIFTSLADNSVGVLACPSSLLPTCVPASEPAPGEWSGLVLTGNASGAFVNTAIRNATTGIMIDSKAVNTAGSSVFGLIVSHSSIGPSSGDGINAKDTPISVTDSTIWNTSGKGLHGLRVNLALTTAPDAALRISGVQFKETGSDAILGEALSGHPVWITDNHIASAHGFGMHLQNADSLVLRNNNISGSGGNQFSAIYLDGVKADFVRNVRGNVGTGNYVNALVFHGNVTSDLTWITPGLSPTHALGYMLDGAVTMDGPRTLTVKKNDIVKSLGGPITLNGGTLKADDSGAKLFTSLRDMSHPLSSPLTADTVFSCPSVFTACTVGSPGSRGDWGGIVLSDDGSGNLGKGSFTDAELDYTVTAITIDSGAAATSPSGDHLLTLKGTGIKEASVDGINAQDTPISIGSDSLLIHSSIDGTGSHGIVASYFSGVACPVSPTACLKIDGVHISNTRKDAILANGLTGLITEITSNCIGATAVTPCIGGVANSGAGTYGIRLVGADNLTLKNNSVFNTGNAVTVLYPAIYLNGVSGDFGDGLTSHISGNTGAFDGKNAMVFHGAATTSTTWQTVDKNPPRLGYMLDGTLTVTGDLTAIDPPGVPHDVIETLNGSIAVSGNLTASGATFTSLRDQISGITGCGTPFVPFTSGTNCKPPDKGDWYGLSVGGHATLDGTTIKFAGNSTLHLSALQLPGGPGTKLDCISVHGNLGGIQLAAGGGSITNSNLFNNSGTGLYDLNNQGGAPPTIATPIWWGPGTGTTGPAPGQIFDPANATTAGFLATQDPTVTSFTVKDDNTNTATGNFGQGTITVSVTFSRKMNVGTMPQVTFNGSGDPITTLAQLTSGWNADGTTWTATYKLDKATTLLALAPTSVAIDLTGVTSCIQDANNAVQATPAALPFTVDYSLPTPALTLAATNVGQTATLAVKINPQGWPTTGFFQVRASGDPYGTLVNAPITGIGSGSADETLTAVYPPTGTLNPGVTYFFQAVAHTGNGDVPASNELSFTATDVTTNFLVTAPATAKAGAAISVNVTARDHLNNTVGDYPGTVGITSSDLGTNTVMPPSAKLTAGQGVFSVTLTTLGNQTVTATDTGDSTIHGTTSNIMVNPGDPAKLAFDQAPTTTMHGAEMSPAVTIDVEDSLGHVVTGDNATNVTVAIGTNPSGGTLSRNLTCGSGTLTDQAASGVVKFDCLSIDNAGIGYTLAASATGLTGATSSAFTVVGPATQIAFTAGPSNTPSSTNISPDVVVKVQDALGSTVISDSTLVTLTLNDPSSNGGALGGTAAKNADHGVAKFSDLKVDAWGSNYSLHAADGAFTADSSPSFPTFTITGSKLVFGVQPSTTMHDASISPAVTVQVEDSLNHVVTGDTTTNVTIALANNTSGGTLSRTVSCGSGTLIQKVAAGVATFDCLSVDKAEIGYTLTAATTGLTGDTSNAFTIVGPASQIAFTTGPSDTPSSTVISPDVVVKVQDALGSTVIDDSSLVTLTLNDPSANGGALSGSLAKNADHGVATFNDLKVDHWGANYSLHASEGAFTADSSPTFPAFKITGSKLVFTQQPTDTAHSSNITPAVTVAIEDSLGNVVDDSTMIGVAIDTNPGTPSPGTLTGGAAVAASHGTATFGGLSIDNPGNGYTLKATGGGLTSSPSSSFNIT